MFHDSTDFDQLDKVESSNAQRKKAQTALSNFSRLLLILLE